MATEMQEPREERADRRSRERLNAYDGQLLLRGVVIAGYASLFSAYRWEFLVGSSTAAGVLLFLAGGIGLIGLLRRREGLGHKLLRLGDGVADLLFGGILIACAVGQPAAGPIAFGVWAIIAGLLLIIHAVPSRLRDVGPAWAWIWTGVPLALLGVATLMYGDAALVSRALWLNGYALTAATMSCMLGFGMGYPYVLALPETESSGETMFSYDDVTWRRTPPELEQHDLDQVIAKEEKPGGGRAA